MQNDVFVFDQHGMFEIVGQEIAEQVSGGNSIGVNTACSYGTNPTCGTVNDHCGGSGLNGTCVGVNVECRGSQYPNGTCVIRNVEDPR